MTFWCSFRRINYCSLTLKGCRVILECCIPVLVLFVCSWVSGFSECFSVSPRRRLFSFHLKTEQRLQTRAGQRSAPNRKRPLSRGRLGTATDENAIKTNSPADRGPSPVSLLITCSKAWDPPPPLICQPRLQEGHDCKTIESPQSFSCAHPLTFTEGNSRKSSGAKSTHSSQVGGAQRTRERRKRHTWRWIT